MAHRLRGRRRRRSSSRSAASRPRSGLSSSRSAAGQRTAMGNTFLGINVTTGRDHLPASSSRSCSRCCRRSGPTPAMTPRRTSRRRPSALAASRALGRLPFGGRLGSGRLHLPVRADHSRCPTSATLLPARQRTAAATSSTYTSGRAMRCRASNNLGTIGTPRRRHRLRDDLLRPLVHRVGRADAVRLQPRRRRARAVGLAEEGVATDTAPQPTPLIAIVRCAGCSSC